MFEIPIYDDSNRKRIQQKLSDWGNPGFLNRGFKFIKGGSIC